MKSLLTGSGIVVLAALVFTSLSNTGGIAAVITGVHTSAALCVEAINKRDNNTLDVDAYEILSEEVNIDNKKDVILKNTTDTFCGSAGCVYEICLQNDNGVDLIPFSYASHKINVLGSITENMHDIALTGKSDVRLIWDHNRYIRSH